MRKNNLSTSQKRARRSLCITMAESGLTAGNLAMPILSLFLASIGLSHEMVSDTQIVFTVVLLALNIPMGYIADRFSRKWANIIGDLLHGISLLLYASINSFYGAILCESICGVGLALSQGVDSTFVKHFSEKYKPGSFEDYYGRMAFIREVCTLAVIIIGAPIASLGYRKCLAAAAIPSLVAAFISLFIHDDSEKLEAKEASAFSDMAKVIKEALIVQEIRIRIAAYVVMRESTHAIIWIFSDLMVAAGISEKIVAAGWLISALASILGNTLANKFKHKLKDCAAFIIPMTGIAIASAVMSCSISLVTVWFYFIFGVVKGWTGVVAMPPVKNSISKHLGDGAQTTVESLAKVLSQLFYLPALWLVGHMADIDIRYGMLATFIVFVPTSIIVGIKLRKFCKQSTR